jgi:antitoxin MazE
MAITANKRERFNRTRRTPLRSAIRVARIASQGKCASPIRCVVDFERRWIYNENVYPEEGTMQVSKWGNSLAVRLPAAVVQALELKEGDEIEISVKGARTFAVERDRRKLEALERLRKLRIEVPADFKFDRKEIYGE